MHIYDARRFFVLLVLVAVIAGGLLAIRFGYVPEIGRFFAAEPVGESFRSQISGIQWEYKKIFGPSDIPLPSSTAGTDARVKAIYSPSVVKLNGQYFMAFGVSIYCNGWATARDSIALAKSSDGRTWQFDRYILEPDPRSCTDPAGFPKGVVYQVNDPSVQMNADGSILVFYTTVEWGSECGLIGLSTFDKSFNLVSRNDRYMVPTSAQCGNGKWGFSRPDLQWYDQQTSRLWFDSAFHIQSISLTNLQSLNPAEIRDEDLVGGDLDVTELDYDETLLLTNGAAWVQANYKKADGSWESFAFTDRLSGQGWDVSGQGSPNLVLEPDCRMKLYMSGSEVDASDPTGYRALSIGMAEPIGNRPFNFPRCENFVEPTAPDRAPIGFFDAAPCRGFASGWATDPDGSAPVTVRFFDGPAQDNWTNLLGETTATVQRGDPVGAHGFEWKVPDALANGVEHRIYAYAYSNETPTVFYQLPSGDTNEPPPAFSCSWSTPVSPEPEISVTTEPGGDNGGGGGGGGTQTETGKPGDVDGNQKVDIFDYNSVVSNFGKSGSGVSGDLDDNGKVDIFDYNEVVSNFNK